SARSAGFETSLLKLSSSEIPVALYEATSPQTVTASDAATISPPRRKSRTASASAERSARGVGFAAIAIVTSAPFAGISVIREEDLFERRLLRPHTHERQVIDRPQDGSGWAVELDPSTGRRRLDMLDTGHGREIGHRAVEVELEVGA